MEKPDEKQPVAHRTVSVLALAAVVGGIAVFSVLYAPVPALAQEHGDHEDGGGQRGQGGQPGDHTGGGHDGGGGHDDGDHDDGDHDDEDRDHDEGGHEGGGGRGGPGADPSAGSNREGGVSGPGGRPPWSREDLAGAELGRLDVARLPAHVIDRAYAEAVAQLPSMASFYNLPFDRMLAELREKIDDRSMIQSPLENLALLKDGLDGTLDLGAYGITNDRATLMAVFLGVAAERTIPITPAAAFVVSVCLERPMTEAEAVVLADRAEAVRLAILVGSG